MALRFNPPPNWPAPPEGFVPPAGWQPDPAWGPAPEGWQLWVDDASVPSAPVASSASDPAWAPTQAVSTGSAPVADPTGQPVSAPSADYSAPVAASGPDQATYQQTAATAPLGMAGQPGFQPPASGGSAPMAASAPTSSPYAASMDYAQSPTPYQPGAAPQGFGAQPQAAGWQPLDVNSPQGPGSTPVTRKWWFWAIIVVAVLALVGGLVAALMGGKDKDDPEPAPAPTSQQADPTSEPSDEPEPVASATTGASGGATGSTGGCQQGTSQKCPGDLGSQSLTLKASEYSDDPNATVDLTFGDVVWDGTEQARTGWEYGFEEPGQGNVYMRLPVTVTYHGEGQLNLYSLDFKYVRDGNTFTDEFIFSSDELTNQTAPYDGGSVTGYVTFKIPAEYAHSGAFAISFNYKDEYWMAEM